MLTCHDCIRPRISAEIGRPRLHLVVPPVARSQRSRELPTLEFEVGGLVFVHLQPPSAVPNVEEQMYLKGLNRVIGGYRPQQTGERSRETGQVTRRQASELRL